jgi:uncharacterized membrane protein
MGGFLTMLTLFAALGCGVAAGIFFAFSAFVMRALDRLPAPQAIAAMQAINAAAPTPAFMAMLFGTALACSALIVSSLFAWGELAALYLLAGGALYLICVIGPTAVYHVPRNEALAKTEPHGADAASHGSRCLAGWTAWNHLRFAGALAASAALTIALVSYAQ